MKENRNWTIQVHIFSMKQDIALRQLREVRCVKKWTEIARILDQEFQIKGKSGKSCRERYYNHVSSNVKRDDWTVEQQNKLFRLHNQNGNKWVFIAQQLQRPDNAIKNHYHSKLRKALRKINKIVYQHLRNEFKPIKNSILPKIIQTAEQYHKQADKELHTPPKHCFLMKNKILNFLYFNDNQITQQQVNQLRIFVKQMNQFNKTYKKRKNKKEYVERQRCNEYKGKEILNLIHQNQKTKKLLSKNTENKKYEENMHEQSSFLNSCSSNNQSNFQQINEIKPETNTLSWNGFHQLNLLSNQNRNFANSIVYFQRPFPFLMMNPISFTPHLPENAYHSSNVNSYRFPF